MILPALTRLGLPFPLGGTSNHFRVDVLRAIGGWDSWNVTEDADLGFRLWRQGWRVRQGLRNLSGWTHRATQEEWPEVPVPTGPTELRLLGLRMRELTNYRHHREDDIRQTAFRDTLTHLPNRAYFQVRLDQQINEARQGKHSGALVTLDIQRFKHVNAVLGQA